MVATRGNGLFGMPSRSRADCGAAGKKRWPSDDDTAVTGGTQRDPRVDKALRPDPGLTDSVRTGYGAHERPK